MPNHNLMPKYSDVRKCGHRLVRSTLYGVPYLIDAVERPATADGRRQAMGSSIVPLCLIGSEEGSFPWLSVPFLFLSCDPQGLTDPASRDLPIGGMDWGRGDALSAG